MFFNGLASARQYARAQPPGKCSAMPLPHDLQLRRAGPASRGTIGHHAKDQPADWHPGVASHLIAAVAACGPSVIVGLAGLEGIGYSGLSVLLRVRKWTRRNGGDLPLAAPRQPVRRILEANRVDRCLRGVSQRGRGDEQGETAGRGHRPRRSGSVPLWFPGPGGRYIALSVICWAGRCPAAECAGRAALRARPALSGARREGQPRLDRSRLIRWFSRQAGIVVAVIVA